MEVHDSCCNDGPGRTRAGFHLKICSRGGTSRQYQNGGGKEVHVYML